MKPSKDREEERNARLTEEHIGVQMIWGIATVFLVLFIAGHIYGLVTGENPVLILDQVRF